MLKILIQLLFVYMLLQYVFKVDVNEYFIELIEPAIEKTGLDLDSLDLKDLDLEKLNISPELLEQFPADKLQSLVGDTNLTTEEVEEKLKQLQEELKKHMEKAENI